MKYIQAMTSSQVRSVEALHLRAESVTAVADGTQEVLIVRITADSGQTGLGEIVSCASVGRAVIEAPRSARQRHGLAVILTDAGDIEPARAWTLMYEETRWYGKAGVVMHALGGVDVALWDLAAQRAGVSVAHLLGQRHQAVPGYASLLFPADPVTAAHLTEWCVTQGFRAVKFGWGPFGLDRDLDLALLREIRAAAGPSVRLMVDAGRRWEAAEAIPRVAEIFDRYELDWVEEPLREDDLAGYEALCRAVERPIAAGETEDTTAAFARLAEAGVSVLQPDLGRCGGITAAQQIASRSGSGCRVIPHAFGTGVNLAASLHWAASLPDPMLEMAITSSPLRDGVAKPLPALHEGMVPVPAGPGLGVSLDHRAVDRYRVRGASS
jgi:L-rhamnonate dehydratase